MTQEEAAADYATLTCESENVTGETSRPEDFVATCSEDGTLKYLLGPTIIEGTEIDDAAAATEPTTGGWIVLLDFKSAGRQAWAEYTAAHVGENVAFTLDGRVISAPTINGAINGQTTITGDFDQETSTALANQLKYGALPLTFSQATAQSISTELGAEQLQAGLIAGAIGIALVFVYALIYYRLLGLVMIASLHAVRGRRLRLPGPARPADRLHAEPRRDRGLHRVDRHHGGLVRRVLRTPEGRDPGGPDPALRRPSGVGPRPAHDPLRRRRQLPGRGDPLPAGDR